MTTTAHGHSGSPGSPLIAARGVMADLTRAFPWEQTPVGPPQAWPRSLKTILNVMLTSQHPMFLWWGPELIQFYNDGYRPSLGDDRHPAALGAHGREFWAEIWPAIGPQIEAVMERGESTWNVDHLVPISRNRRIEEVYWTYGYSPVLDDDGRVGGTLVIVQETTAHVVNERHMAILQMMADRASTVAQSAHEVCQITAEICAEHDADFAFAQIYVLDEDGLTLRRVAAAGCMSEIAPVEAMVLGAEAPDPIGWPLGAVVSSGHAALVTDLSDRFRTVPGGRWPEPASAAIALPIMLPDHSQVIGVLVAGLSPRLPIDESYQDFLRLFTGQIGNALANARAHHREQVAREQLERLFEKAPSAIALLRGPDHVFTLANPAYLELAGRQDLLGKSVKEALPEVESQGILELLDRVYADGQPFIGDELPVQLARGDDGTLETLHLDFVYAPMFGSTGAIEGIFVHAYDVTDQVRGRLVAEAATRAQDEFLSIASHELRNPIAGIKGTAQLMRRLQRSGRLDGERLDRYLSAIEAGSNRLTTLTEDLLDVSRLQQGELELRLRDIDLADLCQEIIGRLPQPTRGQVRLDVSEYAHPILLDPDRIEQIIVNLLDNAAKYSVQDGGIEVSVRQDASGCELRVRDHGIGIPVEAVEQIFEPFGRAPNAKAANIPGLGLGLYICRQIAHRHSGRLWAESAGEGQGTTFILWLPNVPTTGAGDDGG